MVHIDAIGGFSKFPFIFKIDKNVINIYKTEKNKCCGSTGINNTVPINTLQVPNTTGTVMDSGSV